MPHRQQLNLLKEKLSNIISPVVVIQGMQDSLVSPGNADYVERQLKNLTEIWRLEETNYFIPWSRPEIIERAILQLAE